MAELVSSLAGVLETTVDLKSSAEQFHDLIVEKPHHMSNASPSNIQNAELHEGELGQVGSVTVWNYVLDGEAKVVKAKIEAIDAEKNQVTYAALDGDLLKEYSSFVVTVQVTPKEGEPGSVAHWHIAYVKINEEVAHPENLIQFATDVSKDMDQHLMAVE